MRLATTFSKHLRSRRKLVAVSLTGAVVQAILLLAIPLLVRYLFVEIVPKREVAPLFLAGGLIALLYLSQTGVAVWARVTILRQVKRATTRFRRALLDRLYGLSRGAVQAEDRGKMHAMIVHDTERVDVLVNTVLAEQLPAALVTMLLCIVLAVIDIRLLGLLAVLALPGWMILRFTLKDKTMEYVAEYHARFERFSREAYRALELMDLTRLHAAEPLERNRQNEAMEGYHSSVERMVTSVTTYSALQQSIVAIAGVLVLVAGGALIAEETLSTGDLIAFFVGVMMLRNATRTLASGYGFWLEGRAAFARIRYLLLLDSPRPYSDDGEEPKAETLALENVSFGYNGKRVLEGIDLTIEVGETVAVTGANGSGKTSILYLLLGLYAPQNGRLLADGMPYSSISISSLRRRIGVVTQDPVLFAGTIAENIAYTDMDADAEAIEAAARSALAHDFIADLPNGYDTKVGESGVFLSGGQRQRITLARALLKRPRLLILDEPSNHLDPETTAYLINHLAALPERPGILVITHDPHLAEQADRIYHLQDGRLVSTADVVASTS